MNETVSGRHGVSKLAESGIEVRDSVRVTGVACSNVNLAQYSK